MHIVLQPHAVEMENLKALSRKLRDNEGFVQVAMSIKGMPGEELKAAGTYSVEYSTRLVEELKDMDMVSRVWIS